MSKEEVKDDEQDISASVLKFDGFTITERDLEQSSDEWHLVNR